VQIHVLQYPHMHTNLFVSPTSSLSLPQLHSLYANDFLLSGLIQYTSNLHLQGVRVCLREFPNIPHPANPFSCFGFKDRSLQSARPYVSTYHQICRQLRRTVEWEWPYSRCHPFQSVEIGCAMVCMNIGAYSSMIQSKLSPLSCAYKLSLLPSLVGLVCLIPSKW
jgi:hypothetical protein